MFIRLFKVAPVALACALSFSLAAPSFAHLVSADGHAAKAVNSVEDQPGTLTLAPEVNAAAAQDASNSTSTQKHENAFLRALAAPFRALARLFGGGKKSTQAKNTKSTPAPQQTQQAPNTPTHVTETQAAASAQAPTKIAPQAQVEGAARPSAQASRRQAPAPAARRSSSAKANATPAPPPSLADAPASVPPTQPEKFMPVPEGVPLDPLSQGRALLERGDVYAALAPLSIAAVTGPDLLAANNLLGLAYDRLGQHKLAVECYTRALIAAPNDPATLNNLGHSLYLADRYNEALT
ncbi:MAG TPA: tetratricopeptide repeat protein, partial [Pyrinomonadaceae bacterium]|nr:tetratricopeptide repeat protein [Pyrinomonadaceae bacterium]